MGLNMQGNELEAVSWLGFDSLAGRLLAGTEANFQEGLIPPKHSVYVVSRPQIPFRGRRLVVNRPGNLVDANCFLIHELRAGTRAMTVNHHPVPASAFVVDFANMTKFNMEMAKAENRDVCVQIKRKALELMGQEWSLPALMPGTDVTFVVENIGEVPARFVAAFMGDVPRF